MGNIIHLKRFFMEVYNDPTMYNDYLAGNVFLNQELYAKWHQETVKRNELFARSIEEFDRIKPKQIILEEAISDELTVSEHLFRKKRVEVGSFERFEIEKGQAGNSPEHYICNGYFNDTLNYIYEVLNGGAFTVGICCEKKTELFKEVVSNYNKLKGFLLKNGYSTSSIETNTKGKNRVYLLMYDSKKTNRALKK